MAKLIEIETAVNYFGKREFFILGNIFNLPVFCKYSFQFLTNFCFNSFKRFIIYFKANILKNIFYIFLKLECYLLI